jgi:capsular polysaccharide transport system permease protein
MSLRGEVAVILRGARMQRRVIGALIIRELHTRFGRHYFGYALLFFVPLLLGTCIGLLHHWQDTNSAFGSFEFYAVGYIMFFIFRGIINGGSAAIPSNRGLLYHRTVTLPDIFLARHIIETVSAIGVLMVVYFGLFAINGDLPENLTKVTLAMIGIALLSQGIALLAAAAEEAFEGIDRMIHATTYLVLPVCGMGFLVEWLPNWAQELALYIPTVHLFELLRDGQFGSRFRAVYDPGYVIAWIMVTHLLGLAALRITRQRLGLE